MCIKKNPAHFEQTSNIWAFASIIYGKFPLFQNNVSKTCMISVFLKFLSTKSYFCSKINEFKKFSQTQETAEMLALNSFFATFEDL